MSVSTTMTIRVSPAVKEKLGRLAHDTRRTKSFLAGEAVAAYVDRELAIIQGIHRGLTDVRSGHVVPHEEAMAELEAVIVAAESKKA